MPCHLSNIRGKPQVSTFMPDKSFTGIEHGLCPAAKHGRRVPGRGTRSIYCRCFCLTAVVLAVMLCCGTAMAQNHLRLVSSTAVAPFIITKDNTGIEIDIVKEAFAGQGYTVSFEHLPFPRALEQLKNGTFDGALTISGSAPLGLERLYASQSHLAFRNVAISLKKRGLRIETVGDLAGKSVVTFQYAKEYLGKAFSETTAKMLRYRELPQSEQIISMLYGGRTDVIVIEINIFTYLRNRLRFSSLNTEIPVSVHRILPEIPLVVLFHDRHTRDIFNQGLARLREQSRYQAIFDAYLK